jgi:uncharacterized membrane protein
MGPTPSPYSAVTHLLLPILLAPLGKTAHLLTFAISARGLRNAVEHAACQVFPPLCILPDSGWIAWNLCLAIIPLALSVWLFRRPGQAQSKRRPLRKLPKESPLWWILFLTYMAFLPNAPYLLTDVIHSINSARMGYSAWMLVLLVIPMHLVAIVGGFEAYVLSLINQQHYLVRQGAARWVNLAELITHALCAVGIYLGRFDRLNSWDLVQDPSVVALHLLNTLTARRPVLVVLITFVIITSLYWVMKQITLGLGLRYHQLRAGDPYGILCEDALARERQS